MSTTGSTDPQSQFNLPPAGVSATSTQDASEVNSVLIQQTKNEIRSLVQEITHLSQTDIPLDEFYDEFLRRVVQALASSGGALWTVENNGGLRLQYQVNLPTETLADQPENQRRHGLLLQNVLASGQPTLVPPQSGSSGGDEAGNPTNHLLVLACLRVENEPRGVIEIFQRSGGGPTTQRGYLRFLVQMAELASEFLKNRQLRQLGDSKTLWENLERFICQVHRGLNVRQTGYTIVNESRRLVRCDRVSLTLRRGGRQQVVAVSGLDTLDRRAEEVKLLGQLATAVVAGNRPLWYGGADNDVPPQIDEPLQQYVDQSHATMVAVVPLRRPPDGLQGTDSQPSDDLPKEVIAALIVEQMGDLTVAEGQIERVDIVAQHSASALANALDHESLFLMPLWRMLGKAKWVAKVRNLPKVVLGLAVVVGVVLALALVPADFELSSRGTLQPSSRHEIYAHLDGVITEVPVRHEQPVQRGDVLVRMKNNELEVEIADLIGRNRTTQERIRAIQRAQLHDRRLGVAEQNRLGGELLELKQVAESIDRELILLRQKQEQLVIRSETHGQVVTWGVSELLLRRPVQTGRALMTIVDPMGAWELELNMPERRMGHISRAARDSQNRLRVTFVLSSHPGLEFEGRVTDIHRTAEVQGDEGNSVLIRVAIDKQQLPELRSDTTVTAKVNCGRRSIGYVVFHELLETVQSRVLFWL
ncbi:MAG: HlyD family efflux transporter periplasmic adaptor subunit [Pirellulaceae bacterium]|jgi:multidrug efflux pump subunit AcrA (membrane-fusion protein)|nr:HlyD family efflux transporter periplasmic adaptor subunit [Pirellulaceae bacterium]